MTKHVEPGHKSSFQTLRQPEKFFFMLFFTKIKQKFSRKFLCFEDICEMSIYL